MDEVVERIVTSSLRRLDYEKVSSFPEQQLEVNFAAHFTHASVQRRGNIVLKLVG
jgi:hypothetical protein